MSRFWIVLVVLGASSCHMNDQDISYRYSCDESTTEKRAAFIADCVKCGGEDGCVHVVHACTSTALDMWCKKVKHICLAKGENGAVCHLWEPVR